MKRIHWSSRNRSVPLDYLPANLAPAVLASRQQYHEKWMKKYIWNIMSLGCFGGSLLTIFRSCPWATVSDDTENEAKLAPPSNFIQVWCYSGYWDSVLQRGNAWGMLYHYPWLAISICGPAATIDVNQLFISYEVEQNVLWKCKRSWGFTTMVGPGRQEHV